ncbi:LRR receptor-like serine/threonine-protein kinase RPK2 [Acorus calamus]|uniref:LRR receptor-like serine/threonine-protein kinase RPK2 n=1 Tax=Acorus calamus TaxID=4465 RepID=A0AAV9EEI9_ACOCL|nr:LRR receptor-like serine/threonine-protein kinase RPK2 [Acorus calamus]
MGGFSATYKAELSPKILVAVKRLSMGMFQGLQQFDAEIRTLGRIRHKNLVTLVRYHTGDASDTFLIYNYLSGRNLEMFIKSGKNAQWPVVHKIALNVSQVLAYLHYSCEPRIVHSVSWAKLFIKEGRQSEAFSPPLWAGGPNVEARIGVHDGVGHG